MEILIDHKKYWETTMIDPYLGSYGGGGGPAPGNYGLSGSSSLPLVLVGCMILLVASSIIYAMSAAGGSSGSIRLPLAQPLATNTTAVAASPSSPPQPSASTEAPIATDEPDEKLAAFAFESLVRPGQVPSKAGTLIPKPAGNPPYKLVQCGKGYAIRWMGRYLSVDSPNKLVWTESKQEPHSCFRIIPGYCDDQKYVMLRSIANSLFVRPDDSGALVCKDTPTARNAKQYCWKLNPDVAGVQPCGCTYSQDLQRVVCTPCGPPVNTRPAPGSSCSTVTPGHHAQCCLSKTRGDDAYCQTVTWPETVGRNLQEAMLYLRTKRPDLVLTPCPSPCAVSGYPTPAPNVVVIPYDPRTMFVTAPARRLL